MITIEKLMEDTNSALCSLFTKVVDGVKIEPEVYDHTDEIFSDGEDGVSVWCDINFKALSWFDGNPNFIISYSKELCEGSIDLFLGDECTDTDAAMDAADEFYCDGVWHIEEINDFLMLQATFTLDVPDELEEKIIKKLKALEDVDFTRAIRPVADYFK